MNKFKKMKVLDEIVKLPATRNMVELIANSFNDVNGDDDYKFSHTLETRLAMIIHCIYKNIYDIEDVIPNKELSIHNRYLYNSKIFISRELMKASKEFNNKIVIRKRFLEESKHRIGFAQLRIIHKNPFKTKLETRFPMYVDYLDKEDLTSNRSKLFIKEYEAIENRSSTAKEFLENLVADGWLKEWTARHINRKTLVPYAYKKLGITTRELDEATTEIRNTANITKFKKELEFYIKMFKSENRHQHISTNSCKKPIAYNTVELCKLGALDEWTPLFDYKRQKNRNKTYAYYLKNKNKTGWCKITRSMQRASGNDVIDLLVYTGQAKIEISKNNEEWIKITIN